MLEVVKHQTDIKNIYTYFEFHGYDTWDQFDHLLLVLTTQMACHIVENLEGVYSRHCILQQANFTFQLLHHEDFGNCLCNQNEQTIAYYAQLEKIALKARSKIW